jgi:hypothetical protein
MICQPCKENRHWDCVDVVRGQWVHGPGNPTPNTGRVASEQNGWLTLQGPGCDCQHMKRRAPAAVAAWLAVMAVCAAPKAARLIWMALNGWQLHHG